MADSIFTFTITNPQLHTSFQASKLLRQCPRTRLFNGWQQVEGSKKKRSASLSKVNALPDWPLMAMLVQHTEGQPDFTTIKSVWHLSDQAIKNVYVFYIMFTVWGCMFFSATKDPYYDSEVYRGDGGDGTGHWFYEKQENMEAEARAELWKEELIEEIEQKVGGLQELEEAGRK
ncbi:photosynthetic NDH subunit of subcomplex B 4, chloroplastic [Mangifera indica]|uniref:photosynthetic NDH subunit of subcomplex B 4, chloroplastic n=1 Tax=Mangifera indica TaxID=29780 RepID=UPI001CFA247D|nr:photosynthetic NDH subunit of subcomplex B 4, chloroplastic [Mangifera indica]